MKKIPLITIALFSLLLNTPLYAATETIPEDLKPWKNWVLKDHPTANCPTLYNQNKKICAYPNELKITINNKNGLFEQSWNVHGASWIPLPGDLKYWPQHVTVNEQTYPVLERNKKPFIRLKETGKAIISGQFFWNKAPKNLQIPSNTGLIDLTVNHQAIILPDFRNARLWFKQDTTQKDKNNRLELRVFRKITDAIPMKITTQIQLDVSGKAREIELSGALLNNFIATNLSSKLPSYLDKSGQLKVQIRPGQWTVQIQSVRSEQINKIDLPEFSKPWPKNELWVFEQQAHLRRVTLHQSSIDSNQTHVPKQWKKFPAYLLKTNEQLSFDVLKRGNPDPEPDSLTLAKKIWLDFNGKGFTINDKITGKLSEKWRLNVHDTIQLGQVTVDGKPQFITQNEQQKTGIELRQGQVNLSADSRIENLSGITHTLNAVGWETDVNATSATLYLPAGWHLFNASGVTVNSSWITKWTLLDLFIVLITSIAVYQLFGLLWSGITLVTLVLTWHQGWAPQYVWLHLIVTIALIRVLPKGRLLSLAQKYRIVASIALMIIALPFLVNQARTALYPQLEFHNGMTMQQAHVMGASSSPEMMLQESDSYKLPQKISKRLSSKAYDAGLSRSKQKRRFPQIDPNSMIQTGPGLPRWQLHRHFLRWEGPVSQEQNISLVLISPAMTKALNVLRIFLVALLVWRFLDIHMKAIKLPLQQPTLKSFWVPLFLIGSISLTPTLSEAKFPSQELLTQLQQELLKPAKCLPDCASIESLAIDLSSDELKMNLRLHAQEAVSIPLPIPIKQWQPNRIELNEQPQDNVFRQKDTLWINIPKGSHDLHLIGRVDYLNELSLGFPLQPHHINLNVTGWTSQGMNKDASAITAITFNRIKSQTDTKKIESKEIPVYAQVTRTLELGLNWMVTTQVIALSGTAYPAIFKIPLLPGESVITDNMTLKDQNVIISLKQSNRGIRWTSNLNPMATLTLKAISSKQLIERWTVKASPIWHMNHSGIPVIYSQQGKTWQPQWHPWPGEEVTLNITRPEGVKGRTLTIDSSTLTVLPGEQITASTLEFVLRSSRGGQHTIKLPEDSNLQKITINGRSIPIRNTKTGLIIPVVPGEQRIKLEWQENKGISYFFSGSQVDLGIDSVNHITTIQPGSNRWVLFTEGPTMGPAVLFWGVFGIILLVSIGLGRIKGTPLKTIHWVLLWAGLSASEPVMILLIAGTIFAFKMRGEMDSKTLQTWKFNLFQVGLVLLSLVTLSAMISVINMGLLGSPDMQITGNGSTSYALNWFSDRIDRIIPEASFISVPLYLYRLLMLLWSIWLAFAMIKWAQWGWQCFSKSGYWRAIKQRVKKNNPHKMSKKEDKLTVDIDAIDESLKDK